MVVNDDAGAGYPCCPGVFREQARSYSLWYARFFVGASLLAKVVNDDADA